MQTLGLNITPELHNFSFWQELEHYMTGLSSRPSLLAVNKMDVSGAEEKYDDLIHHLDSGTLPVKFLHVFPISSKEGTNVDMLKEALPVVLKLSEELKTANMPVVADEDTHSNINTHSTT